MRYKSGIQPSKCPKCGSERVARILYGEPMGSEGLMADLMAERIVLGGYCIAGDNPKWNCVECETDIYRR